MKFPNISPEHFPEIYAVKNISQRHDQTCVSHLLDASTSHDVKIVSWGEFLLEDEVDIPARLIGDNSKNTDVVVSSLTAVYILCREQDTRGVKIRHLVLCSIPSECRNAKDILRRLSDSESDIFVETSERKLRDVIARLSHFYSGGLHSNFNEN